jgi:pimeloyl-ACP methyl ester carboxylesterase
LSYERATRLISLLFPAHLAVEIDRRFGGLVATARAGLSPAVLTAQEAAMEAWHRDTRPGPGVAADVPVLVAHGDLDVVIPPANVAPLAARFPGATVEIFDGCGHALMAQQPQRLVELIVVAAGPELTSL